MRKITILAVFMFLCGSLKAADPIISPDLVWKTINNGVGYYVANQTTDGCWNIRTVWPNVAPGIYWCYKDPTTGIPMMRRATVLRDKDGRPYGVN